MDDAHRPRPAGSADGEESTDEPASPVRSGAADLGRQQFVGFLPITDVARAVAFYCDGLGLELRQADDFAVVLDAGGTPLRLAVVEAVPDPVGTNAGWQVADVGAAVRSLTQAGVVFERFDGMGQDPDGVWTPPGGGAVAWFRDPDGNRLSLSE